MSEAAGIQKMEPGKILLTGGTGFVGSHTARSLLADGFEVRALLRPSSDAGELEKLGAEIVRGDLLDPDSTRKAVDGCRTVYHLAAQMLAPGVPRHVYISSNTDGTRNLARSCVQSGINRLVFASSSGVYGIIHHPPVTENDRINPTSPYRESKWLGEQAVRQELAGTGTEFVIARLSGLMGPGSLNWLGLCQAIARGGFRIIGNGKNHDNVAYVSDVVQGLRRCAETPGVGGEVYLIGGKPSVSIRHIVQAISDDLGVEATGSHVPVWPYRVYNALGEAFYKTTHRELPGVHRYALFLANKILDLSKAERELGYQPEVSFAEGLRQTIDWYRARGLIGDSVANRDKE